MSKCWIFDLDGTLVDSEKHIRETFIKITKEIAPERIDIAAKVLIGPPLEETAKEILGDSNIKSLKFFTENFIKIHDDEILSSLVPESNFSTPLVPNISQDEKHIPPEPRKQRIYLTTKGYIKNILSRAVIGERSVVF